MSYWTLIFWVENQSTCIVLNSLFSPQDGSKRIVSENYNLYMFKTNKMLTFAVSLILVIFIENQILKAVFAMDLMLFCAAAEFL